MCWNGAVIGMAVATTLQVHRPILLVQLPALTACSVGAAGAALRRAAVLLIASATILTAATTTSASVWLAAYRFGLFTSISKLKFRA